ncbi:hypothetical protein CPB86DRAFT_739124 [Serendipita vermifera]|nr:hypothetical protein CPB86DRAFT_739124 [Serendipita vermifera]
MAQRAGIALGRVADNAPFVVTRVDGAPHPPTIAEPVEHMLDGHSITEMMTAFERAASFTTTSVDNGLAITYPLALSKAERDALEGANQFNTHDHLHSFANDYAFHHSTAIKQLRGHRVMFIDLTPGQVAASLCVGSLNSGIWYYSGSKRKDKFLNNILNLTTQDVIDKLINPLKGNSPSLNCVGILRPDGAFPDVSNSQLEAQFPDTLVKWVSLAELSQAIAMVMHRQITTHDIQWSHATLISIPLGLVLADGRTVTLIPSKHFLPADAKAILTTSKDNQTTATLRFTKGLIPCGEIVVEGLTPQVKGAARIKVMINCEEDGRPTVTVEQFGSLLKTTGRLDNLVENHKGEDIDEYNNAVSSIKQVVPVFGQDGVIGELPE